MDTPSTASELAPISLPSSPHTQYEDLSTIQAGVARLATSEKLDKGSALELMRLFHAMELLLRKECNHRDTTIAELRSEMTRVGLQHQLDQQTHALPMEQTPGKHRGRFSSR